MSTSFTFKQVFTRFSDIEAKLHNSVVRLDGKHVHVLAVSQDGMLSFVPVGKGGESVETISLPDHFSRFDLGVFPLYPSFTKIKGKGYCVFPEKSLKKTYHYGIRPSSLSFYTASGMQIPLDMKSCVTENYPPIADSVNNITDIHSAPLSRNYYIQKNSFGTPIICSVKTRNPVAYITGNHVELCSEEALNASSKRAHLHSIIEEVQNALYNPRS